MLHPIEAVPSEWETPLDAFTATLAHEEKVTALINNLYALAEAEKDYPTCDKFRKSFAALYPRFLLGLRHDYPSLTPNDELVCMLIYLKQSTDEISQLILSAKYRRHEQTADIAHNLSVGGIQQFFTQRLDTSVELLLCEHKLLHALLHDHTLVACALGPLSYIKSGRAKQQHYQHNYYTHHKQSLPSRPTRTCLL